MAGELVMLRKALVWAVVTASLVGGGAIAAEMSPQGDTWDSIKQLPDFSGVWQVGVIGPGGQIFNKPMAFTPEWQKRSDAMELERKTGGDIEGRAKYCIFLGFPGGMAGPEEIHEFLYTPGQVTMTDVQGYVRRIYTDGRKHHAGPPGFWGDSIGHWEGGVLVVDTINLQKGNEISYGLAGGPDMHVTERIFIKDGDPDQMQIDTVVVAPAAFTTPFSFSTMYKRHKDWQMTEWDCAQNNRDINDSGKQQMDLVPPDQGPATAPTMPNRGRGSRKDQG